MATVWANEPSEQITPFTSHSCDDIEISDLLSISHPLRSMYNMMVYLMVVFALLLWLASSTPQLTPGNHYRGNCLICSACCGSMICLGPKTEDIDLVHLELELAYVEYTWLAFCGWLLLTKCCSIVPEKIIRGRDTVDVQQAIMSNRVGHEKSCSTCIYAASPDETIHTIRNFIHIERNPASNKSCCAQLFMFCDEVLPYYHIIQKTLPKTQWQSKRQNLARWAWYFPDSKAPN